MQFRRRTHKIPLLNTTATADISFMLLIFFLVTSSMSADKAMQRQLPPYQEEQPAPTEIDTETLLQLTVEADGTYTLNSQPAQLTEIKEKTAAFVEEKKADHLISIETDDRASYDAYFQLHNTVAEAYRQLYEQSALAAYHKPFGQCSATERNTIKQQLPYKVADAHLAEKGGRHP